MIKDIRVWSEEILCFILQNVVLILLLSETHFLPILNGLSRSVNTTLNISTNGIGTIVLEWISVFGVIALIIGNFGLIYLTYEYHKYDINSKTGDINEKKTKS